MKIALEQAIHVQRDSASVETMICVCNVNRGAVIQGQLGYAHVGDAKNSMDKKAMVACIFDFMNPQCDNFMSCILHFTLLFNGKSSQVNAPMILISFSTLKKSTKNQL